MPEFVYVDRNTGQVVFDVVRGILPLQVAHRSGVETLAMLAAVLVCRDPEEYCTDGALNESPARTVRRVLELPVHRVDAVVRQMQQDGLLKIEDDQACIVATDRAQALLDFIHMYYGQFQMFDESIRRKLSVLAEAVRLECGGAPGQSAAVAYMLLRSAGAPIP